MFQTVACYDRDSTMFLKSIWVWVSTVLYPPELVPAPANNTIRVIGVGLSRTGTLSTRLALSRLLGGKIYHGYESDMDDRADFWLRWVKSVKCTAGELIVTFRAAENPDCISKEDWREFLSGDSHSLFLLFLHYLYYNLSYDKVHGTLNASQSTD